MVRSKTPGALSDAPRILPEIRELIETSRHRVAVGANLVPVSLYWNIGRVITQDIQKTARRAEYGTQLLEILAALLAREYGSDYSKINLQDMRRFYEIFQIDQTPSDLFERVENNQAVSNESAEMILQAPSAEFSACIPIDFRKHFTLGWSHYRLLLGQHDFRKRKFYFEQAASQRWSVMRDVVDYVDL